MIIDTNQQNPICPNSLKLCDICDGVTYRIINAQSGILERGVFRSGPLLNVDSRVKITAKVEKINPISKKEIGKIQDLDLSDSGITQYYNDITFWNKSNFTIPDTNEGLVTYQGWLDNGGAVLLKKYTSSLLIDEVELEDEGYETDEDLRYLCR